MDSVLVLEGLDEACRAKVLAYLADGCPTPDRVQYVHGVLPMPRRTRNPWSAADFENVRVLLQLDDNTLSVIGRLLAYRVTERFGYGTEIELEVHAPHVNFPRREP